MEDLFNRIASAIKPAKPEANYISAEIEVLKSLDVEHVVYLYTDGNRVIFFDHKDFKWVTDYLEVQGFTPSNIVKLKSQYSINF